MEVGPLLIGKEQVRFPDGIQHGWVQVQRVIRVFVVGQPGVVPLLPQEDVDPIVLQPGDKEVDSEAGPGMSHPGGARCFLLVPCKAPSGRKHQSVIASYVGDGGDVKSVHQAKIKGVRVIPENPQNAQLSIFNLEPRLFKCYSFGGNF